MKSSDWNEELGINALNRTPKSQLIKGLDSLEAIVIVAMLVLGVFVALVMFMLKVRILLYILPVYVLVLILAIRVLRHFHKTEKPGYIVSLICYLFSQPKKIYVRSGQKVIGKK